MLQDRIDHVVHGRALLAMRIPVIREVRGTQPGFSDLFESYSLAVIHLDALTARNAPRSQIDEYKALISNLEEEAAYFLRNYSPMHGKFDWAD